MISTATTARSNVAPLSQLCYDMFHDRRASTLLPFPASRTKHSYPDAEKMDRDKRWSAVVRRDPSADGRFFYGVNTTHIFCRPVCKARLARRANVVFFDTVAEAESAGFRACKRCRPQLRSFNPEADKVRKVCDILQSLPLSEPVPGLEKLAQEVGLTKHHFHRLFKKETGLTPREYATANRGGSKSETTISEPMTPATPFTNTSDNVLALDNVATMDDTVLNETTLNSRKQELDGVFNSLVIYHSIQATTYGYLIVAFHRENTAYRVCTIELGTSESELVESLERTFPLLYHIHSPIELANREDVTAMKKQVDIVVEALEQPSGKMVDLPPSLTIVRN